MRVRSRNASIAWLTCPGCSRRCKMAGPLDFKVLRFGQTLVNLARFPQVAATLSSLTDHNQGLVPRNLRQSCYNGIA